MPIGTLLTPRTFQVVTVSSAIAACLAFHLLRTSTAFPALFTSAPPTTKTATTRRTLSTSMPVTSLGVVNDQAILKNRSQQEVFDYLAHFENIASWDPGCLESKRTDDGPLKVGSTFDLVTVFKGTKSNMQYRIVKLNAPDEVVLEGESSNVRVVDTIKVMPSPENPSDVLVDYTADLTLKGWKRPFIVFLGKDLNNLGRAAMDGLESKLNSAA
eukprot:m.29044 g.29044  ORF g.29044 m.29044 type:complete len:214 (+) comp10497_c0_seq1:163-804(+)